jgi:hypothetical protein
MSKPRVAMGPEGISLTLTADQVERVIVEVTARAGSAELLPTLVLPAGLKYRRAHPKPAGRRRK